MSSEEAFEDWGLTKSDLPSPNVFNRSLIPCAFLALSLLFKEWTLEAPRSTYICPSGAYVHLIMSVLQILTIALDGYIVAKVDALVSLRDRSASVESVVPSIVLGRILLVSGEHTQCLK